MPHDDSFGDNSTGWRFRDFMGTASDLIPCDSDKEVTSQFWVFHHGVGNVVGNPIIESDMEGDMPTPMERGEFSRPREEGYTYGSVYTSLSSIFAMTDFNLGTTSDSDYTPTVRTYVPTTLIRTSRFIGWAPRMYQEYDNA
jgi:hypothetical protein